MSTDAIVLLKNDHKEIRRVFRDFAKAGENAHATKGKLVKKMIELIRKEKTGDFEWDSHRLQRVVTMSARPADTAVLEAFLFKEMFPEYRRGAR